MVKKEEVKNTGKVININDKKLLWGIAIVVVIGSLVSGNLTGNAGRINVLNELEEGMYAFNEGGVEFVKGTVVRLDKISEDNAIIVQVVTETIKDERVVQAGHRVYINGFFITNVASDYDTKRATIKIE